MSDTDKRIEEIGERAAAAEPGPWRIYEEWDETNCEPPFCIARGMQNADGKGLNKGDEVECFDHVDAEFIAHAREDVPFLLAQLAAEREKREKAEAMLCRIGNHKTMLVRRINCANDFITDALRELVTGAKP